MPRYKIDENKSY